MSLQPGTRNPFKNTDVRHICSQNYHTNSFAMTTNQGVFNTRIWDEKLVPLLEGFRKSIQLVIHLLLASRQENQVKEEYRPDDDVTEKKVGHTLSTLWTKSVTSSAMLEFRRIAILNITNVTNRTVIAMTETIKAWTISGSNSAPLLVMTTG